ncbi:hypothetical protein CWI39_2527p0010, partial [Hamiltosporidium magnivora]
EIENYKDYNKMTMENLVKIFTPTLFPDFKPFDLTMIDKQIDFIKLLFESDFEEEDGVKILKPKNNTPLIPQGGTTLEEPTNNINEESDLEEETKVVKEVEENI